MNPIALASFGTRLGPWLGRAAASAPTLMARLTSALKVGGQFAGKTVADVVTYVKAKPGNAILVASTLASLGFDVGSLFGDSNDPEIAQFQRDLGQVVSAARIAIDGIGAQSESSVYAAISPEKATQDEVAIEVLSWARGFFGSIQSATEAHRMLQAFIEMPLNNVRHGFATYRLR